MKFTTSNITEGCVVSFPYIMDTISWNMFSVVEGRVVIMTGRPNCKGVGEVRERGLFPT